jgi:epsilon-lactone hydrolase
MPSPESALVRQTIVRDGVPEGVSIEEERRSWEAHAATLVLAAGTSRRSEEIAGTRCVWVENEPGRDRQVIVYIHGGGLIAGSSRTHGELASRMAAKLRRRILLVDYRLAPEHPFPAALDDVTAVYRGLLARLPNQDLVFGADSTGAALALAALLRLRDEGAPLPVAAFFISGHFDMTLTGESMQTRRDADPFTSREALARAIDWYRNGLDPRLPLISPLFASLQGLPPMLLQVGDDEILLSDSVRLAEAVQRRGGQAELNVWDGMWHVWPMYAELPEADAALREMAEFLAKRSPHAEGAGFRPVQRGPRDRDPRPR